MRKLSLLLVALLVVSTGAFAIDMQWDYAAEAWTTWGVQLDEGATGFEQGAWFRVRSTLKSEATEEFGSGDMYGWIEVEDVRVRINTGDAESSPGKGQLEVTFGDITGRVYFGDHYLEVFSENAATVNRASQFSKIGFDVVSLATTAGQVPIAAASVSLAPFGGAAPSQAGAAIGIMVPDLVELVLGVASPVSWHESFVVVFEDEDGEEQSATVLGGNDDNAYALSFDAKIVAVPDVTIRIISNMHINNNDGDPGDADNPAAFGINVDYSMPLTPDITLKPQVGFDVVFREDAAEDSVMDFQFGLGLNALWAGIGTDEDDGDLFGDDSEVTSGVGLGFTYVSVAADKDERVDVIGLKVGLFEDPGDDGLLPVIGGALVLNYNMVLENEDAGVPENRSDLGLGIEVNADLGVVKPFAGLIYQSFDLGGDWEDLSDQLYLKVGTDIAVISNTTFTLQYKSGDLMYDDEEFGEADATWGGYYGRDVLGMAGSSSQAGVLLITTKIAF